MNVDQQKQAAGEAAAALVEAGMIVGRGTGSTAAFMVKALAARGLDIRCVPTSKATADLAGGLGMNLLELDQAMTIDLTIDGADEIGPGLALIKGGGAALLREKLVWEASRRCVVIAEAVKSVRRLGAFPLTIEVVPFGHKTTALRICDVLSEHEIGVAAALRKRDGAPVVTDNGNYIYDAACGVIADPAALGAALKSLTGVVEHGLFLDLAEEALIGTETGVQRLIP